MTIERLNSLQETQQNSDFKIKRVYDPEQRIISESVFKDVNGDGKPDLYKITQYFYEDDDTYSKDTYIDRNGDGYNDYHKIEKFNELDEKVEEKEIEEEDINKVKNRDHFPWETENRIMKNILNGTLVI